MKVYKVRDNDIKFTADMTRQLFEDEPSIKCFTIEQYEDRLRKNYLQAGCEAYHFLEDNAVIGYALVNKDRNYYKDHSKKSYTEKKINLSFDDYVDEINENIEYTYEMEVDNYNQLDKLIKTVIEKIEDKINNDPLMKRNEIIVGDAIVNVLKNWHVLFMEDTPEGKYNKRVTNKFAKNKILLFLKEQTNLSTKEIRIAIKPFKEIYFLEKIDYLDD